MEKLLFWKGFFGNGFVKKASFGRLLIEEFLLKALFGNARSERGPALFSNALPEICRLSGP